MRSCALIRPASRRRLLGGVLAGAVAPLTAAAKHRHGGKSSCRATGKRCTPPAAVRAQRPDQAHAGGQNKPQGKGKHRAPSCAKCCTGVGAAGVDGKVRCACKDDGASCASAAECCGGDCRAGIWSSCPSPCAAGQRCKDGQCICDGESCPNGCCQSQTCQTGKSNLACGSGGATRQACPDCQQCSGNRCVAANDGVCCNGSNGVCQSGQCVNCDCGQRCGNCTCICDRMSCPDGCCAGGITCLPGTSDDACGEGGAGCQICHAPQTRAGDGKPGACGCKPNCAGKGCGADDGCGGKCRCSHDSPICLDASQPTCCCLDNGLTNVCVANETNPTVVCCCPSIGGPTPYCRLAPSGNQCCCTNPDQICTDSGCQTP